MINQDLKNANQQDGWLQKPLKKLSSHTLRMAHPHWSDSEINQVLLMLDLKQENPCGDLGVILT
ncbi:MAG: hypothetical protein KTR27_19605 [Leptolyngbyaceae cyanobacterium MAG.088]|nr:hypothetical protein [Leptolyngbyaceae cyanobacterium MAG.088]